MVVAQYAFPVIESNINVPNPLQNDKRGAIIPQIDSVAAMCVKQAWQAIERVEVLV